MGCSESKPKQEPARTDDPPKSALPLQPTSTTSVASPHLRKPNDLNSVATALGGDSGTSAGRTVSEASLCPDESHGESLDARPSQSPSPRSENIPNNRPENAFVQTSISVCTFSGSAQAEVVGAALEGAFGGPAPSGSDSQHVPTIGHTDRPPTGNSSASTNSYFNDDTDDGNWIDVPTREPSLAASRSSDSRAGSPVAPCPPASDDGFGDARPSPVPIPSDPQRLHRASENERSLTRLPQRYVSKPNPYAFGHERLIVKAMRTGRPLRTKHNISLLRRARLQGRGEAGGGHLFSIGGEATVSLSDAMKNASDPTYVRESAATLSKSPQKRARDAGIVQPQQPQHLNVTSTSHASNYYSNLRGGAPLRFKASNVSRPLSGFGWTCRPNASTPFLYVPTPSSSTSFGARGSGLASHKVSFAQSFYRPLCYEVRMVGPDGTTQSSAVITGMAARLVRGATGVGTIGAAVAIQQAEAAAASSSSSRILRGGRKGRESVSGGGLSGTTFTLSRIEDTDFAQIGMNTVTSSPERLPIGRGSPQKFPAGSQGYSPYKKLSGMLR